MSEMYRSLFNFTPEGTKMRRDLPVAVTVAHTIIEAGFWRRLSPDCLWTILAPYSVILMISTLLNIKFLLITEDQIRQHALCHEVQNILHSFKSHAFLVTSEFMPLFHLVRRGFKVIFEDATHLSNTDPCLKSQCWWRTAWGSSQVLPRILFLSHF